MEQSNSQHLFMTDEQFAKYKRQQADMHDRLMAAFPEPKSDKDLIEQLRAENAALAAALVAKDAALERCTKFTQEDYDALDLKPHAALVRKLKAEAVTEFLEREKKWTINEAILAKIKADAVREFVDSAMPTKLLQKLGHEYADRIERGKV